MRKPFWTLVVLYSIGISAILRADFNYIDDMERIAYGYKAWEGFGRYFSNFLSTFIHADNYLTDVSPLPQMIAVVFLALAGIIVTYSITGQKRFSMWTFVALIPLGLSPYFLECMSYKYDSPYMALSILASVFPILLSGLNPVLYFCSVVGGILIMCTTYQASSGIFPMMVVLLCSKKWNEGESIKKLLRFSYKSLLGYVMGLLIFKIFFMESVDSYVQNSIARFDQLIPVTLNNLHRYFEFIRTDFKNEWLYLIILIAIAFVVVMVKDSKRKKYIAFLLSVLTLILLCLMSFGIYPFFNKPLFEPRAMYGFGIFLAYLGVCIAASEKLFGAKIPLLLLSWSFFVFSFTYGNALNVQKQYTDFRIHMVIDDLSVASWDEDKIVQISGTIGFSPVIKNMPQDYQMINRMVPITFSGPWYWGQFGFYNYYGLKHVIWDSSVDLTMFDLPILQDTMYHTIKGNDSYILIELK